MVSELIKKVLDSCSISKCNTMWPFGCNAPKNKNPCPKYDIIEVHDYIIAPHLIANANCDGGTNIVFLLASAMMGINV